VNPVPEALNFLRRLEQVFNFGISDRERRIAQAKVETSEEFRRNQERNKHHQRGE
jgi:hypothetical protein